MSDQASSAIGLSRGVLGRLVVLSLAILLAGQVIVSWYAMSGFERQLAPEANRKAQAVGDSLAAQLSYAIVDLEIRPEDLVGVDRLMEEVLLANDDITYLALLDGELNMLFARGATATLLEILAISDASARFGQRRMGAGVSSAGNYIDNSFPIGRGGPYTAVLHVGVLKDIARERLSEVLLEILTVIAVSWLVALEAMIYFVAVRVANPLDRLEDALRDGAAGRFTRRIAVTARDEVGRSIDRFNEVLRRLSYRDEDIRTEAREIRDAQIDSDIARRIDETVEGVGNRYSLGAKEEVRPRSAMQIRAPLFLFIFSEELSRSFLPLFIARFSPADAAVSSDLLIGLPITLFMLAAAVVTPFGAGLADRFGARWVFLAGVAPVLAGYIGTFFAQGYYDLVFWRALTGVGYGLIFISSQAWVAYHADEKSKAQAMAVFVGAVFAGTVCGPSIGGILADRIGFASTFLVSAGIAALSGLLVYSVLDNARDSHVFSRVRIRRSDWAHLLRDRQFVSVTLFAALPGKLILAGFLFYLVPLYLAELGNRQSVIGWIIMLYGLSTIVFTPLASRFADRTGKHDLTVAVGCLLAGSGCLVSLMSGGWLPETVAVMVAVIALGVSHALSLTSQLAQVQDVADRLARQIGRTSVFGAYRLLERGGTVIGPVIAAAFATSFGYRGAVIGVGALVLVLSIAYVVGVGASARSEARGAEG